MKKIEKSMNTQNTSVPEQTRNIPSVTPKLSNATKNWTKLVPQTRPTVETKNDDVQKRDLPKP